MFTSIVQTPQFRATSGMLVSCSQCTCINF